MCLAHNPITFSLCHGGGAQSIDISYSIELTRVPVWHHAPTRVTVPPFSLQENADDPAAAFPPFSADNSSHDPCFHRRGGHGGLRLASFSESAPRRSAKSRRRCLARWLPSRRSRLRFGRTR